MSSGVATVSSSRQREKNLLVIGWRELITRSKIKRKYKSAIIHSDRQDYSATTRFGFHHKSSICAYNVWQGRGGRRSRPYCVAAVVSTREVVRDVRSLCTLQKAYTNGGRTKDVTGIRKEARTLGNIFRFLFSWSKYSLFRRSMEFVSSASEVNKINRIKTITLEERVQSVDIGLFCKSIRFDWCKERAVFVWWSDARKWKWVHIFDVFWEGMWSGQLPPGEARG